MVQRAILKFTPGRFSSDTWDSCMMLMPWHCGRATSGKKMNRKLSRLDTAARPFVDFHFAEGKKADRLCTYSRNDQKRHFVELNLTWLCTCHDQTWPNLAMRLRSQRPLHVQGDASLPGEQGGGQENNDCKKWMAAEEEEERHKG
jgi:hypothetical protein